ncbi:hypothetical protein [Salinisphaera sp. T31B1]|uniref:hypothetical protein n=1 Tax=Salinisphaera sp. T31B1 TaxID=727963 RepID=UPI003341295C
MWLTDYILASLVLIFALGAWRSLANYRAVAVDRSAALLAFVPDPERRRRIHLRGLVIASSLSIACVLSLLEYM